MRFVGSTPSIRRIVTCSTRRVPRCARGPGGRRRLPDGGARPTRAGMGGAAWGVAPRVRVAAAFARTGADAARHGSPAIGSAISPAKVKSKARSRSGPDVFADALVPLSRGDVPGVFIPHALSFGSSTASWAGDFYAYSIRCRTGAVRPPTIMPDEDLPLWRIVRDCRVAATPGDCVLFDANLAPMVIASRNATVNRFSRIDRNRCGAGIFLDFLPRPFDRTFTSRSSRHLKLLFKF